MSWFSLNALTTLGSNILLGAFGQQALPTTTPRTRAVVDPVARVTAALDGENWDDVAALYHGDAGVLLTPDLLRRIEVALLGSDDGRQELAARPRLAGAVLSAADPEALQGVDL